MFYHNKQGYTLTELIVVMAIFMIVLMISASAFEKIVDRSSQQSKSVETQIEGIVGLEVLRVDLEQAGFGLPWSFSTAVNYQEVEASLSPVTFWPSTVTSAFFNDGKGVSTPGDPPRAILSGTTTFNKDSDNNIGSNYLVIKSILAGGNGTARKWTNVSFDKDGVKVPPTVWGAPGRDLVAGDQVIVVKNALNTTPPSRKLMATGSTVFSTPFATYSTMTNPHSNGDTFVVYGVNSGAGLRMPFNRADYYIKRPTDPDKIPQSCVASDGIGILYKALFSNTVAGGKVEIPLLDCVADMQVVYGLDTDEGGRVNHYADSAEIILKTAEEIRAQLKEVRVYILAQEGKKDRFYSHTYPLDTITVGETLNYGLNNGLLLGRKFNLNDRIGSEYKNYRWKVYTLVVRPKNLIQ